MERILLALEGGCIIMEHHLRDRKMACLHVINHHLYQTSTLAMLGEVLINGYMRCNVFLALHDKLYIILI